MSENEITPVEKPAPKKEKQSALSVMASKYQVEPGKLLSTLKATVFKGATDEQMLSLCVVANEYGLNPFTKEIYAFPDKGGGIVPVIGADGWYSIVNQHGQFDGCDFSETVDEDNQVESITCRIYRQDRNHPVEVTEYLQECKRNSEPWRNQPRRMLRHRAFIQCARIAFGITAKDPEDAERMGEYQAKAKPVEQLENTDNPFAKGGEA
jgi:phage recombination protein Bet